MCIQGVPIKILSPMKNFLGGVQGNLIWMPEYCSIPDKYQNLTKWLNFHVEYFSRPDQGLHCLQSKGSFIIKKLKYILINISNKT